MILVLSDDSGFKLLVILPAAAWSGDRFMGSKSVQSETELNKLAPVDSLIHIIS